MAVGELHLLALKRQLLVIKRHCVAHDIDCPPAPANICLTAGMTLTMVFFLAIDIPATENNIFTSKQSFSAKYAGRVVSPLTMIPDPVTEQESLLVL